MAVLKKGPSKPRKERPTRMADDLGDSPLKGSRPQGQRESKASAADLILADSDDELDILAEEKRRLAEKKKERRAGRSKAKSGLGSSSAEADADFAETDWDVDAKPTQTGSKSAAAGAPQANTDANWLVDDWD